MLITNDIFTKIGKSHFICEDYIIKGYDYIILADGSTGAKNTDIGARLLCLSAEKYIKTWKNSLGKLDHNKMGFNIISNAEIMTRVLEIDTTCLSSTLIISYYHNNYICVHMYGDGYIILENNDGGISYCEVSFTDSYPFYLSYNLSPDNLESYRKKEIKKKVKTFIGSDLESDYSDPNIWNFPVYLFKTIAIASDGIGSFNPGTNIKEVVKECVSFKTTNGSFLQRRMIRFISTYENDKNFHFDDISIGAFLIKKEG